MAGTSAWGQAPLVPKLPMHRYCELGDASDSLARKCKIVCSVGPKQSTVGSLVKLIHAGMNIARLSHSLGGHAALEAMVKRIREAAEETGRAVAILIDTKGPEIRTGSFEQGGEVSFTAGSELKLVTDCSLKGGSACLALSYDKLCSSVKEGSVILCADGALALRVKSVGADHVITEAMNDGTLGEGVTCHLPGVQVDLPVLQEDDKRMLDFGIKHAVDFLAVSFVQTAGDVERVREALGLRGRGIRVISKIQNEAGVKNFDAICEASDGIMVARGGLGMEIPPESVFVAQKMMVAHCNLLGKPVIIATQMLESMCSAPRPTRAEASDVANAVLDGTDCVMLTDETAVGEYPVEAVTMARRICQATEEILDYKALYLARRLQTLEHGHMQPMEAVCSSAVEAAIEGGCALILALTERGSTAMMIAKYRPKAPILAVTASKTTLRQLQVSRGVLPMLTASFAGTDSVIARALAKAKADGLVAKGDYAVAVHGIKEESPGQANLLKIVEVT